MNDDDLRHALDDATSEVHPRGDFADIRYRLADEPPAARRWAAPAMAAAAAIALVLGGVTWFAQHQQRTAPTAEPADTGGHDPVTRTTPQSVGRTATLPTYFVGDTAAGPRLFSEQHVVDDVHGTDLAAAVQEVVGRGPIDPDYHRWTASDALVASAESDGATVTIDLSEQLPRPTGMGEEEATVTLQSLVWTADRVVGQDLPVRFTVGGAPVESLLGVPTTEPLTKQSADQVMSTVQVTTPTQGEVVPTEFTVEGQASTFEANVVWELKQGDRVVRHGFTTAAECCTLSPYSFTVTAPPGDYTLVVHDTDESDGEGVGTSQDTKAITVQ
jgi:hypothetical protein